MFDDLIELFVSQEEDERLNRAASRLAEPLFARVWENEEDAIYDRDEGAR